MRTYFSFFVFLFLLCKVNFAVPPFENEHMGIKSVIVYKQEASNPSKGTMLTYTEYNKKGNKVITENYNADGTFAERILYTYDTKGNLTEEANYLLSAKARVRTYYFDKNDRKKTPVELSDLVAGSRTVMTYDAKGNKSEEIKYDSNNEQKSRLIFGYTKTGKLLLEIKTNPDSTVSYRKDYKYNKDKVLTGIYLLKGYTLNSDKSYKYDEKSNKIEEQSFTSGSEFNGQVNNEGNNPTEAGSLMNEDGSIFNRATYKYNEKGGQTEKTSYNAEGMVIQKLTFRFDNNGNTIESKEYRDHETIFSVNRSKYDEKGNLLQVQETQSFSTYAGYVEFIYNELGKLENEIRHNRENTIEEIKTFTYNEYGNITKENCEKFEGNQGYRKTYSYNNSNNLIEEAWFFDESTSNSKKIYQYDANANKIKEEIYDVLDGKPEVLNYVYDFQ